MAYLVTGGTGLVGSRIVRDLVRMGESVVAYDLVPDIALMEYLLSDEELKNVEIVQGNILDFDGLLSLCKKHHIDAIVHTASMLWNADRAITATDVNCGGSIRILEVARILNIKKVVYTSSNSVFQMEDDSLIANDAAFNPGGIYGASKTFMEYVAEIYHKNFGLDIIGIRVCTMVFGAFQKQGLSGSMAIEAMYKPAVGLPGHVLYDDQWGWRHADDIAHAHVLACQVQRKPGMAGCFNIGGEIIDFSSLIAFVKDVLPTAEITQDRGSVGLKFWNVDMTAAEEQLGFKPKRDIWESIKETILETQQNAMAPVSASAVFDAPIDRVWEMVSDFNDLKRWHPLVKRSEATGEGEGAIRTLHFNDWWVAERLDALDESQYMIKYSAIDSSRKSFIGFKGLMQLTKLNEGQTKLTWTAGLDFLNPHSGTINAGLKAYYPQRFSHLRQALGLAES